MPSTLTAHRLRFETVVADTIVLNQHKGSSIRGALYHALRNNFCYNKQAGSCDVCPLSAGCPVCTLVSTMNPDAGRGKAVPRPYTIEPPITAQLVYHPGDRFDFGLTLFADALTLFPYVIMAVERGMAPAGIGRRTPENSFQRGRFTLRNVWAENPLTGQRHPVLQQGEQMVNMPDIPITHRQILDASVRIAGAEYITIHFLTPTRITYRVGGKKRLLKKPAFRPIFQRLMERIASLMRDFTDQPLDRHVQYRLVGLADEICLLEDKTRWVELRSYSTRARRPTPTSGFMGSVTFAGDLDPFLPWLLWGQFTHVGKDAVKGNGWYELQSSAFSVQPSAVDNQRSAISSQHLAVSGQPTTES